MSTRSAICIGTRDKFEGVYHHSDGYPSGLGKALFELYHTYKFEYGAEGYGKMLHDLCKTEMAQYGWSYILDRQPPFKAPPTWVDMDTFADEKGIRQTSVIKYWEQWKEWEQKQGWQSYYMRHEHNDRDVKFVFDQESVKDSWCEYAYVFDPDKPQMTVMDVPYHKNLKLLAVVDLEASEPDWNNMESPSES